MPAAHVSLQPDVEMVKSMNQYDSGKNNDGNNMIFDCDIVKMKKCINILENIITHVKSVKALGYPEGHCKGMKRQVL